MSVPARHISLPLEGRRIVVTQAAHQAPEFEHLLANVGAIPLLYPCIAIQPPQDTTLLDRALQLAAAGEFDWLVLTSANAVGSIVERMAALGLPFRRLCGIRVATVGDATADAVRGRLGLEVALTPDEEVAEGLADVLADQLLPGTRVLLPQASLARPVLATRLGAAGARVTQVVAYETVLGQGGVDLPGCLVRREVDAVTLASSSAFRNLLKRLAADGGEPSMLHGICLACIGPITAQTVVDAGFAAAVVSEQQSLEGLVEALARYFQN